jgi:hypothetical protein
MAGEDAACGAVGGVASGEACGVGEGDRVGELTPGIGE